ncbi:MAG: hypothetical protein V4622_07450 [Bacteroidota bacterium]
MKAILILFAFFITKISFADSPLTSTSLHRGYEDNALVQAAIKTKTISKAQYKFFVSDAPLPEKLAVISAFGWGNEGSTIVKDLTAEFIKVRKGEENFISDDYFVLAYAQGLEDYFDMSKVFNNYISKIDLKNEKRESAYWVMHLCNMQHLLDDQSQWCQIYKAYQMVKNMTTLVRDMKEITLKEGIYSYLDIYAGTCTE